MDYGATPYILFIEAQASTFSEENNADNRLSLDLVLLCSRERKPVGLAQRQLFL